MLIRLIYASRSAGVLSPIDVKDIVRSSQRNNAKLGVTGALMLSNGIFLQCLEGDHLVVNALYHRILLDARHREPAILSYAEIEQRLYGAWSMGLVTTTEAHRPIFLKYSAQAEFDPYLLRPKALELLFADMVEHARTINA
jgi:Sensors of blue-light using FAD